MTMNFPPNFKWGGATSSFQIEGATSQDGRGKTIWDTFCETPGRVLGGHTGDIACDHYNRTAEDIAIMKDLGLQSYRFSIAWSRLFPDGVTREQRGFDFYSRLVDQLLAADIEPMVTVYHWDLPQTLQDHGGWANRDIVSQFTDYAVAVTELLADRVDNFLTVNEPWVFTWLGNMSGIHAPGLKDLDVSIAGAHHTALAHGEASRAMRAVAPNISTGLALNMANFIVDDESNEELQTLRRLMDGHINRWWLDAAFRGEYPQELVDFYGEKLQRHVMPGDMEKLRVQTDIVGVNYYNDSFINTPKADSPRADEGGPFPFPQRSDSTPPPPHTDFGWPITPRGLHNLLVRMHQDWPEIENISITENGAAYGDGPDADGRVRDVRRIDYMRDHIEAVSTAIDAGAPVQSYYAWSLLDNFEWAEGYDKRFGIIHVDFETLKRTPKDSAEFYASVITQHKAASQVQVG